MNVWRVWIGLIATLALSGCTLRVEFVNVDKQWMEDTVKWEQSVKQKMDYYDEEIRKMKGGDST